MSDSFPGLSTTPHSSWSCAAATEAITAGLRGDGGGEPLVPQQQPWYQAMQAEPDVAQALRHVMTGVGEITRRVTPLHLVAQVAADGDPDTGRVIAFHENRRADGYREVLELQIAKAGLRPGLSLERANDLLLLFAGMDVYHALVDGRGWSHEEWLDWTVSALAEQVFGRPQRTDR